MSIPRFWRYRGKIIDIENEDCELGTLQEIAAEVLELRAENARLRKVQREMSVELLSRLVGKGGDAP